jgi:heterodisulfide reductase subunit A-like polyferredoxin
MGMVVYACHPSYEEGVNRRIIVQAGLGKKHMTLLEK